MKHFITTLFFVLSFFTLHAQVSVIPKPTALKYSEGKFSYAKGLDIKVIRGDDGTKRLQKQLIDFVKEKNITVVPFASTFISLNLIQATDIPAEGYTLIISPTAVSITSSGNAGLFYGLQSLFQIIKTDSSKSLPCLEIKDIPAYSYRGMHLDELHTFFGSDVIKQYLDAMAKLKLNQFHWQLADKDRWCIALKNNAALTDKENSYTPEQIKDIVRYAQERFINIIPEINLPADAENAQNNKLLIDEISVLFPGNYLHTGNGFMDNETVQYLTSKNKKIIGTDTKLYDNEILMCYKSAKSGWSAAANGTDVIMAPRQLCSFDYYQDWDDEKKSFDMSFLPLDKAYSFHPVGKIKDSKTLQHILGGQAYVSTQFIKTAEALQYQVFPRIIAFAECVWTNKSGKKFSDFQQRLKNQKNYFFKEKEQPTIDLVRIKPKK